MSSRITPKFGAILTNLHRGGRGEVFCNFLVVRKTFNPVGKFGASRKVLVCERGPSLDYISLQTRREKIEILKSPNSRLPFTPGVHYSPRVTTPVRWPGTGSRDSGDGGPSRVTPPTG